jgi:putative ABC transport system ATP-binding protein
MIEARGIDKSFNRGTPHEVVALRGLSLQLEPAEWVTVVGSNGAGKSTLLNVLAGVFPPDAGHITVDGRDITNQAEHERASLVGRVFQNPLDGTAASMSVEENLALAVLRGRRHGLRAGVTGVLRQTFRGQLEELGLGLERRLGVQVGLLSGGQRQAVTLLMATLARPRLLLLDEHTASLDPATAVEIERLTGQLIGEHGLTALMVTHNMEQALRMGSRTLMMHAGQIVLDLRGDERREMTVEDMVARFRAVRREALVDDELLLTR